VSWGVKMEGEDVEEWRKLPCEDRIAHKVICFGFKKKENSKVALIRCGRLG